MFLMSEVPMHIFIRYSLGGAACMAAVPVVIKVYLCTEEFCVVAGMRPDRGVRILVFEAPCPSHAEKSRGDNH